MNNIIKFDRLSKLSFYQLIEESNKLNKTNDEMLSLMAEFNRRLEKEIKDLQTNLDELKDATRSKTKNK